MLRDPEESKKDIHDAFDEVIPALEANDEVAIRNAVEKGVRGYSELRRAKKQAKRDEQKAQQVRHRPDEEYLEAGEEKEEDIQAEINLVVGHYTEKRQKVLAEMKRVGRKAQRGSKERREWVERLRDIGSYGIDNV